MARYIDADKLIEALRADYDREGAKADEMAIMGLADASVKYNHGQFCYLNAIERVKDTPTSDVVPKSEVDKLKAEINAYSLANKYDAEHFMADIKTLQMENNTLIKNRDVLLKSYVRKIFEEIEKVIGEQYENYVFDNLDIEGVEQDAIIAFADTMKRYFAELKKKHTEG